MLNFYHNIPKNINSIAFSVGFFDIYWYSLMYLIGFIVIVFLLRWRFLKKESSLNWNDIFDFLIYVFFGILIGGRIGYVFLYNWEYYKNNLFEIISPINSNGVFVGISGMSYHGALIGAVVVALFFCKKRKISFFKATDFVVPTIPAGYFFGRIGNFLNGELYGRVTDNKLGMFFGHEKFLRWPSQLLEAFFEGIVLFVILWIIRNKFSQKSGFLTGLYLIGYGVFRFLVEFLREPDWQVGLIFELLTLGQILSLTMIFAGSIICLVVNKK